MKAITNSIPKKWLALSLGLFLFNMGSLLAQSHSYNTDESTIALEGYSPVSYIENGQAQLGKKTFKATYDGLTYFFANQDQQKKFPFKQKCYKSRCTRIQSLQTMDRCQRLSSFTSIGS